MTLLRSGAWFPRRPDPWRQPRFYAPPPHGKIYPELKRRIAQVGRDSTVRERLLVSYRETLRMPRLPALNEQEPRTSPTNVARLHEARLTIDDIVARRDSSYRADSTDLVRHFDGTVLHRHWLTHSLLVDMPLVRVGDLASRSNVVYIQPEVGIESPPDCPTVPNGSDLDDPGVAREILQSDSYRNLGLAYGYMSLLDTGVWTGHTLLKNVTFGVAGDCVKGDLQCLNTSGSPEFETGDIKPEGGHGTSSAAILVGDGSLGDKWRGALGITLDYFRVFQPVVDPSTGTIRARLDADAAEHGFENALSNLDRVIVADITSATPDRAAVAMSANNAFDLGAVVIAANGDLGSVSSPGSAPLAIGVGDRDLRSLGTLDVTQAVGPASGGRIKPDIQAPSGSETASTVPAGCTSTSALRNHNSTSGATPYAGAAAALIRNLLESGGTTTEPGCVYAAMILAGRHYFPNLDNNQGAGMIELPTDGCQWSGTGIVTAQGSWRVPIDVDAAVADSFEIALWWPEHPAVASDGEGATHHNNVDVVVTRPDGSVAACSRETTSVFERATGPVSGHSGRWVIDIQGMDFFDPSTTQTVYWAAATRRRR